MTPAQEKRKSWRIIICKMCKRHMRHQANNLCNACYTKKQRHNNPEIRRKHSERNNRYRKANLFNVYVSRLVGKFNVTRPEVLKVLKVNYCQICKASKTALYVDHSHKTGKIRGRLCRHCNFALGQFKDKIQVLKAAIKYLKEYSK